MELSRISKLFADRDCLRPEDALARRKGFNVTLLCGADVEHSYMLQLAVLTAASTAIRCFPGAVRVSLPPSLRRARLLVWPALGWTFERGLTDILGPDAFFNSDATNVAAATLVFGDAVAHANSLRVTFDGWIAKVGPVADVPRLPERQYCTLAGILAASLAVSELFMSFAGISIEAARRIMALSLWRPDLDPFDPAALGVAVEFLPKELWVLGLGHLGNSYLWALATLPYLDPREVEFSLMDFDKVIIENSETGLIFGPTDVRQYKARACGRWLAHRLLGAKLVERRLDANFRLQDKEPLLALCGFDSNPARRDLPSANFSRVIESGLGGTANNFDTINLHTLPNPRPVDKLWPDLSAEEVVKQRQNQERVADTNAAYADVHPDRCGRFNLAGKAVAVPFVGAAAGALVVAEVLRLLHEGARFTDLKIRLGAFGGRSCLAAGNYGVEDLGGLPFARANVMEDQEVQFEGRKDRQ